MQLLELPIDVLVAILSELSYRDLRYVMLTCKTLMDIVLTQNSIWRNASRNKLIVWRSPNNSYPSSLSWYNRCRISYNWCKGIYKPKIFVYDHYLYMPWLQFYNPEALLQSLGSELLCYQRDKRGFPLCQYPIWTLQVPTVKTFDVRTNDISRFIAKNGVFVCGNRDGCVAVYTSPDIRREPILQCHIRNCHRNGEVEVSAVESICENDRILVMTGSDAAPNINFWSIKPRSNPLNNNDVEKVKYVKEIKIGEDVGIRCMSVDNSETRIAVGLNGNVRPVVVQMQTGQAVVPFDEQRCYNDVVRDVQWHDENTLAFVSHSGLLKMIDVRSEIITYRSLDPFQSRLYCMKSDGNNAIVVGSSEYCRCVLYDVRVSGRHLQMYFTQKMPSPVYSLDFDSTKLVAAADRSTAILNFNINIATVNLRDYSQVFEFLTTVHYYENLDRRRRAE